MNVTLKPFDFASAVAKAGVKLPNSDLSVSKPTPGAQFQNVLSQALREVSANQLEASRLQREVALDNPTVSIEQTMVAMQKAQIGFQATLQTRNRLVQAYTDIMSMQV